MFCKGEDDGGRCFTQATIGAPPTQDGHSLAIETPLGKDILLLTALDGVEDSIPRLLYTIETLRGARQRCARTGGQAGDAVALQ